MPQSPARHKTAPFPHLPAHIATLTAVALMLLVTALTLWGMRDGMWTDEQRTLYYVGAAPHYGPTTLGESLGRLAANEWQSPGYYVTVWAWGQFVGWDVWRLRVPSLFYALLSLALTYRLVAQRVGARTVGLVAATLVGTSAFFINFAHDMRAYAFLLLIVLLVFASYRAALESPRRWNLHTLALALTVAATFYTHYFGVFPVATLGLHHLLFARKRQAFWPILAAFVVGGLLFIPWANVLLAGAMRSTHDARGVGNLSLGAGAYDIAHLMTNGSVALGLVMLGLSARLWRVRAVRGLWFFALVGYGLLWAVTRVFPAFTEVKYVIYFWPLLAGLMAVGLLSLRTRWHIALILAAWSVMFAVALTDADMQWRIHPWPRPPFHTLADALRPHTSPDDVVLYVQPPLSPYIEDSMLAYYLYGQTEHADTLPDTYATTDAFYRQSVTDGVGEHPRAWLTFHTPERSWRLGQAEAVLSERGYLSCGTVIDTPEHVAALYVRDAVPLSTLAYTPPSDEAAPFTVDVLHGPSLDADGRAHLVLAWDIPAEQFVPSYSLGVHVEDAGGVFVAGGDAGLAAPTGCVNVAVDASALAAGAYTVKVAAYNWETGARLDTSTPADDGQRPTVGAFSLRP